MTSKFTLKKAQRLNVGLTLTAIAVLVGCSGGSDAPNDPLYKYQWHLKNTGQEVFSDIPPTPGIDLNMGTLFEEGITGKGVVVGMQDSDKINGDHEDLAQNMVVPNSTNTATGAVAAAHATAVAGIIAAAAGNGKGGRGVAPEAKILDLNATVPSNTPAPRITNVSAGGQPPLFPTISSEDIALDDVGFASPSKTLIIKSAGNSFLELEGSTGDETKTICAQATQGSGVGCATAGVDISSPNPNAMTIGAVNAQGKKASYSATGSVLWVAGLGGEFGLQRKYLLKNESAEKVAQRPAYDFAAAIVTTDAPGCERGINQNGGSFNALDLGNLSTIDSSCNYTARANGTSSAAPTVTGVAALMLQVNPLLTWWDIKYILATTARKIDPANTGVTWNNLLLDSGWTTNAAGHPFSNWYGFGLVDATAAVAAARNFASLPAPRYTAWQAYAGAPVAIPYRSEEAGYSSINVNQDLKISTVQIRLKTTHTSPNNLRVALVSPSGTRSIVVPALTLLIPTPDGFSIDLTASNAFLDEHAKGTWKLQVMDVQDPSSPASTAVTSWQMRVLGH